MNAFLTIDHIHLISRDAHAAAQWYCDIFDGEITNVQESLRGAPQIDVKVNGLTIVIRGQRSGEEPAETRTMRHFDAYSSHDEWGIDHFRFTYRGDLLAFCDKLKQKGVRMAVEPWEFKPGLVLCYVAGRRIPAPEPTRSGLEAHHTSPRFTAQDACLQVVPNRVEPRWLGGVNLVEPLHVVVSGVRAHIAGQRLGI